MHRIPKQITPKHEPPGMRIDDRLSNKLTIEVKKNNLHLPLSNKEIPCLQIKTSTIKWLYLNNDSM